MTISVEARTIGQKATSDTSWEVFIDQIQVKYTLGELIASVVQEEVNSINQKNQNRLFSVLSFEEIEEGKVTGEIKFTNKSRSQIVDPQKAIDKALKAFKKEHYFVFVDDVQVSNLKEEISLKADSKVVFLRLTPLMGG